MMTATADANTNLVANLYADVLGRIPAAAEVNYWHNQLAAGQSVDSVVVGFVLSTEHRKNVIDGLYEQYLHRPAEPQGEDYWVNVLGQGVSEFQLLALLVGSQEYYNNHGGDDAGFIRGLYQDVLRRSTPPGPDEIGYWHSLMVNGTSRSSVAFGFINSPEFIGVGVDGMYRDFLRRDADPAGRSYWVGQFQQGATTLQIQRFLLDSSEYAGLAQKAVEPGSQLALLGGPINPTDDIKIEFADQQGFRLDVAPLSVATDEVSVVVPPLIDPATGQLATGTVSVQVLDNSVPVRPATIGAIQIQNLPHSSAPAGTLTEAYVKGALAALEQVQAQAAIATAMVNQASPTQAATLAPLSTAQFTTPALTADLAAEHDTLELVDRDLEELMLGQTQSVDLGTVGGKPATITAPGLQMLDDYLTAALDGVRTSPTKNGVDSGQQLAATAEANPSSDNFKNLILANTASSASSSDTLQTIGEAMFAFGVGMETGVLATAAAAPPILATPLPYFYFGSGLVIQSVGALLGEIGSPEGPAAIAELRKSADSMLHYAKDEINSISSQATGAIHDMLAAHSTTSADIQQAGPAGQIFVSGGMDVTIHQVIGDEATFEVSLTKKPQGVVTVNLTNGDPVHSNLSPSILVFTPDNWWLPQMVTLTAVDNQVADGNHNFALGMSSQSTQPDYQGVQPYPSQIFVTDVNNNHASIVVSPTSGLVTTEDGGSAPFNVHLTSRPLSQVRFALVSTDTKEGDVTQGTGILDATNWQNGITFTVVGKDDGVRDGIVPYVIMLGATQSQDPAYNGLNPSDVSVTHVDNGQPTPTPDTTGHWTGTFTETNPLQTISGNMTLDLKANPTYTTVVTGTMTLTDSGNSSFTSNVTGTVSGSRMVLNVSPLSPGFVIQQFIGTVTQDARGLRIDGNPQTGGGINFVDSSGGQTTGKFTIFNYPV